MTRRVQSLSSRDDSSAETGDFFRPYEMVQTWYGMTMSEARPGGDWESIDMGKFEDMNGLCQKMVPFA